MVEPVSALQKVGHDCNNVVEFETNYPEAGMDDTDNIHSWQNCSAICNMNPDCKKWTWNNLLQRCHAKSGNSSLVIKETNLISGIRCENTGVLSAFA